MKDISVPFSLYDFFAILFPGLFGLIGIYLFFDPAFQNIDSVVSGLSGINDIAFAIVLLIVGYFTGHIFHTFGRFFVERPATNYLGWAVNNYLANCGMLQDKGVRGFVVKEGQLRFPKRVFEYVEHDEIRPIGILIKTCIKKTFGDINRDYGIAYRLVQAFVAQVAPDISNEAKTFSATSAMYESLTVTFLLIGVDFIKGMLSGQINPDIAFALISVVIILASLCFGSSRRYKRMWVETTYAAFVSAVKTNQRTIHANKGA